LRSLGVGVFRVVYGGEKIWFERKSEEQEEEEEEEGRRLT